jgi:hypothetical protein
MTIKETPRKARKVFMATRSLRIANGIEAAV